MSTTDLFGDVIHSYTRAQAIGDGVLVDGTVGDLAEVTRQHFKIPVAMTAAVFELMERAVAHPNHCNDFPGVWHDILWMSRRNVTHRFNATCHLFEVIITGTGRQRKHTLKAQCHAGDQGEPILTIMLADED
jgi:hypothetical protein